MRQFLQAKRSGSFTFLGVTTMDLFLGTSLDTRLRLNQIAELGCKAPHRLVSTMRSFHHFEKKRRKTSSQEVEEHFFFHWIVTIQSFVMKSLQVSRFSLDAGIYSRAQRAGIWPQLKELGIKHGHKCSQSHNQPGFWLWY